MAFPIPQPVALRVAAFAAIGVFAAGAAGQGSAGTLAPLQRWSVGRAAHGADTARVADVIAWRAAWAACGPAGAAVPDVDFARHVVLVVVRPLALGDQLVWRAGERAAGRWRVRLATEFLPRREPGAMQGDGEAGAMFLLPRDELPFTVELARGEHWLELARLDAAPVVAGAAAPPVLRALEFADCGAKGEVALCVESAAEWRQARATLALRGAGLPDAVLPDDWADFAHERVVVFAGERARVWPGFGIATSTEEDIDVLTLTQTAPSGEDPGERAPCLVLKLPRRPHALSLVLRFSCGPAPSKERTVATFPAVR